jgi:hypothetical protein
MRLAVTVVLLGLVIVGLSYSKGREDDEFDVIDGKSEVSIDYEDELKGDEEAAKAVIEECHGRGKHHRTEQEMGKGDEKRCMVKK